MGGDSLIEIVERTLEFSKDRDYVGYDKADGMSSKILKNLPINNKWIDLAFQESVKRAPVNIRPLLLVEKKRSYKGTALFSMANLNTYKLTDNSNYLEESRNLADWLIQNRNRNYRGFCGGHQHPLQGLNKKSKAGGADIVSTSYAVKALLSMGKKSSETEYLQKAKTSYEFVRKDLDYTENDLGAKITYKPNSRGTSYTLNANALGARLLIDLYSQFSNEKFKESGRKILDYVVSNQTEDGGWMYTDPPSSSHLNKDNYHNGFILESLLRYQEINGSNRYEESIEKALQFYKDVLYNEDGSPNWDENNEYPKDTHAAAQGIIVFTKAGELEFAKKIIDWTLDNLYAGDGQFYYQKRKFYTKKFTLMRWCQAWMAYANSKYLNEMMEKSKKTRC